MNFEDAPFAGGACLQATFINPFLNGDMGLGL
jgi:hypothetical protein